MQALGLMMKIKPRQFAAVQYGILSIGLMAVWHAMLMPAGQAREQLESMFEANSAFSICFIVATLGSAILSVMFWSKMSDKRRWATMLVVISVALFILAVLQFSQHLIIGFGTGAAMAVWVLKASNSPFDTDEQARRST